MTQQTETDQQRELEKERLERRRKHCLSLSINAAEPGEAGKDIVERARAFEDYLNGASKK